MGRRRHRLRCRSRCFPLAGCRRRSVTLATAPGPACKSNSHGGPQHTPCRHRTGGRRLGAQARPGRGGNIACGGGGASCSRRPSSRRALRERRGRKCARPSRPTARATHRVGRSGGRSSASWRKSDDPGSTPDLLATARIDPKRPQTEPSIDLDSSLNNRPWRTHWPTPGRARIGLRSTPNSTPSHCIGA